MMLVALFTVKLDAAVEPKLTAVAPVKFAPVIVTVAPPASTPRCGAMLVMEGPARKLYWLDAPAELAPPAAVTTMLMVPTEETGETAVMLVALFTV